MRLGIRFVSFYAIKNCNINLNLKEMINCRNQTFTQISVFALQVICTQSPKHPVPIESRKMSYLHVDFCK